jgi:shikimate dehydrogenase
MTRLAVLGSPIEHSRSPQLQLAAYGVLGLDWSYERIEALPADLPSLLAGAFRGLSLTMPLKRDVLPLLDTVDEVARLTGGANTVLFDGDRRHGFNTDVAGIVRAFARSGVTALDSVRILGAGATAASALVAAVSLGATRVHLVARSAERARPVLDLGATLGVAVSLAPSEERTAAVINTLPGGAVVEAMVPASDSVLFEVAYDPWPSALVAGWAGPVIDGLDMLVEQALMQVRIFVGGSPDVVLADEETVLAAMRASVTR